MYQTNIWAVSKVENKIGCFFLFLCRAAFCTHVGEGIFLSPDTVGKGEVISWQPQENLNLLTMAEALQNKQGEQQILNVTL